MNYIKLGIFIGLSVLIFLYLKETRNKNHVFDQIIIGETELEVEIADNPTKRALGLMYRSELDKNKGMLFSYPNEGNYSMWMKNTLIPLDIIWINSKNQVVHVVENVKPCEEDPCASYSSPYQAKYVLEVNSGFAKDNDITPGIEITF